jgi:P4 family phage/plasmid primase-like protien
LTEHYKLKPRDYSDVGQAQLAAVMYSDKIRYNPGTGFLVYNGKVWEENSVAVKGLLQEITDRQLTDSEEAVRDACLLLAKMQRDNDQKGKSLAANAVKNAKEYRKYAISARSSGRIKAALSCLEPYVYIDEKELDRDGFLLNTPLVTVNLKTGEVHAPSPADYCTKITAVSPNYDNCELWDEAVKTFCCGDSELAEYLKQVSGMFAIGKVLCENLIIAVGTGKNGKSTFFNTISAVLGSYSGGLSAEILTTGYRGNKKPEFADLRGKRLIIAAELEEGQRLDTATVKKITSTDPIRAEAKYKDPFDYIPTHTTVLYTNHLPKVGTADAGTWRRLVVVPFNAVIENTDIKNYTDYLVKNAGGAVLSWIIEGAKTFIENDFNLKVPKCVENAISDYKKQNDWLGAFIDETCNVGNCFPQKSGELYKVYRSYCIARGEYARSNADFTNALIAAGFKRCRTKAGIYFHGLSLKVNQGVSDVTEY